MQSKSMQPPVSTSREALRCLLVGLHVSRTFLESLNCRRVRKMFVFSHSNQRENIAIHRVLLILRHRCRIVDDEDARLVPLRLSKS
jgi:hypothetical protein